MRTPLKSIVIALTVNILENYCIALYSFYCTFLGPYIFSHDSQAQLSIPIFLHGLQFFMKPLSGLIFGYIGDKYGRRPSLIYGVMCITVPTLCISLIPPFEQIGLAAPLIFAICLCLQAIGTSAAFSGGATYVNEFTPPKWKGFVSSLFYASIFMGAILMNITGIGLQKIFEPGYVWRVAYFLGGLITLLSLYYRHHMEESPAFKKSQRHQISFQESFYSILKNPRHFIATICMGGAATMPYYFLVIYLNKFLIGHLHVPQKVIFLHNLYILISWLILMIIFGYLAKRLGEQRLIKTCSVGLIAVTFPLYFWLNNIHDINDIFWIRLCISIPAAGIVAPCTSYIAMLFPPEIRQRALGLGYFTGGALFGGFGPLIADCLVNYTHIVGSTSILLIMSGVLGLIPFTIARPVPSQHIS